MSNGAPPRSLLVGGPLDGETISASQSANFVWVQLSTKGQARCYSVPQRGRHLYRLVHRVRPYKYLYAGHTHAACECGALSEMEGTETCLLCGEPLPNQNC